MSLSHRLVSQDLGNTSGWNETILQSYGLIFYQTNRTLSNSTVCYYIAPLTADQQLPVVYENGTLSPIPNSCSDPVRPINSHGILGIVFGCMFIILIVLTLLNLQRHYRHYHYGGGMRHSLRSMRRPYFLALLGAVMGVIASFIAIDVDREVIPGVPFKLQCMFYSFEQVIVLLTLFETSHRWISQLEDTSGISNDSGSTQSRNFNVWSVSSYVLTVISICLIATRNWVDLSMQLYALQIEQTARPTGTDIKFKVTFILSSLGITGVIFRLILSGAYSFKLVHGAAKSWCRRRFTQLVIAICLCVWLNLYNVMSSFFWHISPYNAGVRQGYYYCGGILPSVLALALLNITGIAEDRDGWIAFNRTTTKIRKRNHGIAKPRWWRHSRLLPFDHDMIPLDLHNLKDVRGRNERYSDTRWWWQSTEVLDDTEGHSPQPEPPSPEFDTITQGSVDALSPDWKETEAKSSHASASGQSVLRQTLRYKQGPVQSMLNVEA